MGEHNKISNQSSIKFNTLDTEELIALLQHDSELPETEFSDPDTTLSILEVITKRNPQTTSDFTDIDVAWTAFMQNYFPTTKNENSLYENEEISITNLPTNEETPFTVHKHSKHKRGFLKFACAVFVICIILFSNSLIAHAFGYDLWGIVAEWSNQTFHFVMPHDHENVPYNPLTGIIDDTVFPKWLPAGYEYTDMEIMDFPSRKSYCISYTCGDSRIHLTISVLTKPVTSTFEKDENEILVYEAGQNTHYIMQNINRTTATWFTNNYECSFTGKLKIEEVKKIIDSIYEK